MVDDLVPKSEVLKKYEISDSTFKRRKKECEASPFRDAIVTNERKIYVHLGRWVEFMDYKSKKDFEERYGL